MPAQRFCDLPVAILCGGKGTRLGELTRDTPKALVDVNGRPFIHWQLDLLRRQGFRLVVVCTGHLARKFDGVFDVYSDMVVVSEGSPELGTADRVRRALPLLGDEFWVLYGDSYLDADFAPVFERHRKIGRMACLTLWQGVNYGMNLFKREAFGEFPEENDLHWLAIHLGVEDKATSYRMPRSFLEIGSLEGLEEVRELLK